MKTNCYTLIPVIILSIIILIIFTPSEYPIQPESTIKPTTQSSTSR